MQLPSPAEIDALPPDGGPEFNRLVFTASPYLLQHARNPVDWRPWGEEALARARQEDKPLFLSVGYSTCHWCHVMERESFENEAIAALLNEHFICVKVDREERPDIDSLYMKATQLATGRGGWPNSVWLTPEGRPWFAGTYFPPEDMGARKGFPSLLRELAGLWRERREEIESQALRFQQAMEELGQAEPGGSVEASLVDRALARLAAEHDARAGGFGAAPKFPPHGSLALLFAEYERRGDESLLSMATGTLDAMIAGGIHDQLGGGFHRYSTDDDWLLPHFEKMLYDNAQILGALAEAYRQSGEERYRGAAVKLVEWLCREMRHEAGAFYSALDADSEGEEGRFYVWTLDEITGVLGAEEGACLAELCGVREEGNFRDEASGRLSGANVLHLPGGEAEDGERFEAARRLLLEARARRVRPHLDDKVIAAWNALLISGLVKAGEVFGAPGWIDLAAEAADFLLREMHRDGRLLRSWREGTPGGPGYLDDYAFLARALLDLHRATGAERWQREALALAHTMIHQFEDPAGGFYFGPAGDDLLMRGMEAFDQAIPSGNGVAAALLLDLEDESYRRRGEACLARFADLMARAPGGTESLLLAAASFLDRDRDRGWRRQGPLKARLLPGDGEGAFILEVLLDEGWHVNAPRPLQAYLHGSGLRGEGVQIRETRWPEPERRRLGFSEDELALHGGRFAVELLLGPPEDGAALILEYQPCDEMRCLSPQLLRLPLKP